MDLENWAWAILLPESFVRFPPDLRGHVQNEWARILSYNRWCLKAELRHQSLCPASMDQDQTRFPPL